jgi:hypothetical protein
MIYKYAYQLYIYIYTCCVKVDPTVVHMHLFKTSPAIIKVKYQVHVRPYKSQQLDLFSVSSSRGSAVGIATGYGIDDLWFGVRFPARSIISTSLYRLDRLWGPLNLLFNGHRRIFPRGKATGT